MYELNGIKYKFKRPNVRAGLRLQAILEKAETDNNAIEELCEIAVNHLVIYVKDGKKEVEVESPTLEYCDNLFDNPFFTMEIVENFGEEIKGFLEILPSYKKKLATLKKGEKSNTNKS